MPSQQEMLEEQEQEMQRRREEMANALRQQQLAMGQGGSAPQVMGGMQRQPEGAGAAQWDEGQAGMEERMAAFQRRAQEQEEMQARRMAEAQARAKQQQAGRAGDASARRRQRARAAGRARRPLRLVGSWHSRLRGSGPARRCAAVGRPVLPCQRGWAGGSWARSLWRGRAAPSRWSPAPLARPAARARKQALARGTPRLRSASSSMWGGP